MVKRPRDPNQLAKLIVDIATGEAEDSISPEKRQISQVKRGRAGGLKGGRSRAKLLSAKRRTAIAKKAARSRWNRRAK